MAKWMGVRAARSGRGKRGGRGHWLVLAFVVPCALYACSGRDGTGGTAGAGGSNGTADHAEASGGSANSSGGGGGAAGLGGNSAGAPDSTNDAGVGAGGGNVTGMGGGFAGGSSGGAGTDAGGMPAGNSGGAIGDCSLDDGGGYNTDWAKFECEVFRLVNEHRVAGATCRGKAMPAVPALKMNASLRKATRDHSKDMADNNYFAHNSQDGTTYAQRIKADGYIGRASGENIAAGQKTPADAVSSWMSSQAGHCENIMGAQYQDFGVGYAYAASGMSHHLWTQDFGGK